MESQRSPPGSVRRHGRNISHSLRQSAATGLLEQTQEDPLANDASSPTGTSVSETVQSLSSPYEQDTSEQEPLASTRLPSSLAFLQDPNIYHQLTTDEIPKDLLRGGHFRRAAEQALRDLLAGQSNTAGQVLQLFYVRLACLILVSRPDIAAQEAVPLTDLLARTLPGTDDLVLLIPWDLRLLLVRLQAIRASDGGRHGIMALYALSGEVRAKIRQARSKHDAPAAAGWSARLQDLALRVCDALVEMGELDTASRHLESLQDINPDEVLYRQALLRVRTGDIEGAYRYRDQMKDDTTKKCIEALLDTANGDYNPHIWQSLAHDYPSFELFAQNAAVSSLYTGQIASARHALENLTTRLPIFPTLLFNLSTIYELCSERSVEHKESLALQAAAKAPVPDSGGWERSTHEFKL